MAKHVVTGAAGFLGRQIVERLHARGEEIVAIDLLPNTQGLSGVTYVQGDVRDAKSMMDLLEGAMYVHHNAALVPLTKSGRGFYETNALGTRNVVDACRAHQVKKLVHMSSSAIYGVPERMPITDETPYRPVEIYGQSKLDAEKEVWKYIEEGGQAVCIRPRTIIGGKTRLGIFQILFEWIRCGKNIYVIGDGSNLFQFVHVDDLMDASIKAAFSPTSGLYNIGAATYGTLREDLTALIAYAKTNSRVVGLPVSLTKAVLYTADMLHLSPLAPWHYLTYHKPFVFDISKAQRDLDWQPKYSNIEALIESYEWYLSHRSERSSENTSAHTTPVREGILKIIRWFS